METVGHIMRDCMAIAHNMPSYLEQTHLESAVIRTTFNPQEDPSSQFGDHLGLNDLEYSQRILLLVVIRSIQLRIALFIYFIANT